MTEPTELDRIVSTLKSFAKSLSPLHAPILRDITEELRTVNAALVENAAAPASSPTQKTLLVEWLPGESVWVVKQAFDLEKHPCDRCEGTGQLLTKSGEQRGCDKCYGRGTVETRVEMYCPALDSVYEVRCDADGAAYNFDGYNCYVNGCLREGARVCATREEAQTEADRLNAHREADRVNEEGAT